MLCKYMYSLVLIAKIYINIIHKVKAILTST